MIIDYLLFLLLSLFLIVFNNNRKGIRVSGGFVEGKPTDKSIFFHEKSNNSRLSSPLPLPLAGHCFVKLGKDKKYLFGGLTLSRDSPDLSRITFYHYYNN